MPPQVLRSTSARRVPARSVLLLVTGCTLLGILAAAPRAHAVQRTWTNALGGTAGNAGNWNPAATPSALDSLLFDLANTYSVTFGFNVPSTNRIEVADGTVSFTMGVPHTHTGSLLVGFLNGVSAIADFTSGDASLGGSINIGVLPGEGTLRITGSGTNLTNTTTSQRTAIGFNGGTGTLVVRDGGSFRDTSGIEIGSLGSSSVGTLKVTGEGTVPISRRSSFTATTHYSDQIRVGYPGTGTVEVRDGGLFDVRRNLLLGSPAGSSGTLVVGRKGALDSARVKVTQNVWAGRNDDPLTSGGTGAILVESGGVVEVTGTTYLSDTQGGPGGTITIDEGGRYATGSLIVDDPAGDLVLNGGKLQVVGGTLDTRGQTLSIGNTSGTPIVELLDGATCAISTSSLEGVRLGISGTGRLNVRNGSVLTSNTKKITVGAGAGGNGTLLVDGGTVSTNVAIDVGTQAPGTITARNGASITTFDLDVAQGAVGPGTISITDAGTTFSVTNFLEASGSGAGASTSPSSITVANGGQLNLNRAGSLGFFWPLATLHVDAGGILNMNGSLNVDGLIEFNGGTSNGGEFSLRAGAVMSGTGNVLSNVVSLTDTTMEIRATGPLTLGRADQANGFRVDGSLLVNQHTVTLQDADTARVGSVWLNGGRLIFPPGGGSLYGGGILMGSGRVDGSTRNRGAIAADVAPGISFSGVLESYGRPVSGTVRFLVGGGFKGRGTLAGSVYIDSGAVCTNEGALSIGNVVAPGVVDISGRLECMPTTTTLYPADTAQVRGVIAMKLGTLATAPTRTLRIQPNGALTGIGTCTIKTIVDGTIAPGDPASANFGTLTMTQIVMRSTGKLEIELGSIGLGFADKITGLTRIDLAGTLDIRRVSLFVNPGDSVQIISSALRVGTFSNLTLDGGPVNGLFEVHYTSTGVWVVFPNGLLDAPPVGQAGLPGSVALASLGSPGVSPQLELALPVASRIQLEVFDLRGRRLTLLADGEFPAGRHRFRQGLAQLPVGQICFARARVAGPAGTETRRVRLIRLR